MGIKIRNLRADEIECRIGSIYETGVTLLLYKNARVDQAILDEVFGMYGWQRRHSIIGNSLYCWDPEKVAWISKQDVGTTGEFEKEKSAASDSFKRACVNLGIGRELYTAPFIFVPMDKVHITEKDKRKNVKDSFYVQTIEISEEKIITGIVIVNQKKEEVYRWGHTQTLVAKPSGDEWKELYQEMARTGVTEEKILKRYGVSSLSEMDEYTRKRALNGLKRTRTAA